MNEGAVFGNPPKGLFSRWSVHVEVVVGAGGEDVPVRVTLLASWLRLKGWDETNGARAGLRYLRVDLLDWRVRWV